MKRAIWSAMMLALGACAQAPAVEAPGEWGGSGIFSPLLSPDAMRTPCPPLGWSADELAAIKASGFEIADAAKRQAFAKAITACLASPYPELRDGVAYEALAHMLRAKQLSDKTKRVLLADLTARLNAPAGAGFEQPFAALALSEIARADRVEAFLSEDELIKLLVDAQHWFINVSDYRGFDEREGWRHGVAHGADLLMQLALNPRIDAEGLGLIVSAIGVQVAPKGHAYVFGESERLASPVLFAASRGALDGAKWGEWLMALTRAPEGVAPQGAEWLAWRHNVTAFLQALFVKARLGGDAADDVMLPGLEAALKAMP